MADDKSYITEAREVVRRSWWAHDPDTAITVIATEFTRIASEATRVEMERCAEALAKAGRERTWGIGFSPREAVAIVRALSSIPPQPSEGERG